MDYSLTKSFAYQSELNFMPFGRTKRSDKKFSNEYGMLFMYKLKRNGLKIEP